MSRFLLDLSPGQHEALRRRLAEPRLERFIGVIYRPETERWSHYSEAVLPGQFDAYVWFDETRALTALGPPEPSSGLPEDISVRGLSDSPPNERKPLDFRADPERVPEPLFG